MSDFVGEVIGGIFEAIFSIIPWPILLLIVVILAVVLIASF